jgi:hypothetical protein
MKLFSKKVMSEKKVFEKFSKPVLKQGFSAKLMVSADGKCGLLRTK